ncbi:MAG TPA: hypothetical protein DCE14_05135 [Kosmotogaceae bacterium]|nr:hypothetical protein [Kosmotogaceae bacterium]
MNQAIDYLFIVDGIVFQETVDFQNHVNNLGALQLPRLSFVDFHSLAVSLSCEEILLEYSHQ